MEPKPRKKRQTRPKKVTLDSEAKQLSAASISVPKSVTEDELKAVTEVLSKALFRHRNEAIIDKEDSVKEIESVAHMLEEFVDPFILIGFTLTGEKVFVFNAKNQRDEAAIVDLLREVFFGVIQERK